MGWSGISNRGVFDKETRRKPLAFAADAVRYGISTAAWIGTGHGESREAWWECRQDCRNGVEDARERMRGVAGETVARRQAHECAGVREHIPGPPVVDTLRRIEVCAWG